MRTARARWGRRREGSGTSVDLRQAQGVQVGTGNVQNIHLQGRSPLHAAADQLAEVTRSTWSLEAKRRGIVTPAPATVRWQWGPAEIATSLAEVRTAEVRGAIPRPLPSPTPAQETPPAQDAGPVLLGSGVVSRLHDEVYGRLPHGRLVLLGAAGAGKTGAMILLLLAALHHRNALPEEQRNQVPVPVWLTLGGWDPEQTPLLDWAAATMNRDHPYLRNSLNGPEAAATLLRAGDVALFLDGLDEMPPAVRGAALTRLDHEATGVRIVLTSRPDEYQQALGDGRLHNAAVIQVRPVRPRAAGEYLIRDQIGTHRDQWMRVARHLRANPDGIAARALDNPLTLSLARSTYQHQDPAELIDPDRFPTVENLRATLIERVLTTAYPDQRQRAHATEWLSWTAHHLAGNRDLAWWHIPGWLPRWQLTLITTLTALPGAALIGWPLLAFAGGGSRFATGIALVLASMLAIRRLSPLSAGPVGLRPRWPGRGDLTRLAVRVTAPTVVFGAAVGLVVVASLVRPAVNDGLGAHLLDLGWSYAALPLAVAVAVGIPVGVVLGLYRLWGVAVPAASTPKTSHLRDRRMNRRVSLVASVAVGLIIGLCLWWLSSPADFESYAGAVLVIVVLVWLAVYLLGRALLGPAAALARAELALRRNVRPMRFMALFEHAARRQVLRQAGAVYQFRHAELQDHLASQYRSRHGISSSAVDASPVRTGRSPLRWRTRRVAAALTVAALLTTALVQAKPAVTAALHPDHLTLTDLPAGSVAFSPDGRLLACADSSYEKTVLWDVTTRRTRKTLPGATLTGASEAFDPDGEVLATAPDPYGTGNPDRVIRWSSVVTGMTTRTLRVGRQASVLALSPDGSALVTNDYDAKTAGFWDLTTGTITGTIRVGTGASAGYNVVADFSPDSKTLAIAADVPGPIQLWNVKPRRLIRTIGKRTTYGMLAFSPDGKTLATDGGGRVRLWDVATGGATATLPGKVNGWPFGLNSSTVASGHMLSFSPDGKTLAGGDPLRLWNLAAGSSQSLVGGRNTKWMAFSAGSDTLAAATSSNGLGSDTLRLWDTTTGRPVRTFTAYSYDRVTSLAFSPNGKLLATGWTGQAGDWIRIWDLTNLRR